MKVLMKRGCCCSSLRRGCMVIGIIFMITSAVVLLMEIGLLAEWADVQTQMRNKRIREFSHPAVAVALVLSFIYIIFSILLLQGVKMEKRLYLLPWLVWTMLSILLASGSALYHFCLDNQTIAHRVASSIMYAIIIVGWIYTLFLVFSYYQELSQKTFSSTDKLADCSDSDEEEEIIHLHRDSSSVKIYPHSIWEASSASSTEQRDKKTTASYRLTSIRESTKEVNNQEK